MIRISKPLLALIACMLCAAPAIAQDGTLKKIKDNGYITVGHRDASIPFSYYDDKQQPIGFAMDLCAKVVDAVRLRFSGREFDDPVRPGQRPGQDAVGVMVAAQEKDRNAAPREPGELPIEKQADRCVLPVAVENVSRDHSEGDVLLDRLRHEILEGGAARARQAPRDALVSLGEPVQGAAEMQVGCVDEAE